MAKPVVRGVVLVLLVACFALAPAAAMAGGGGGGCHSQSQTEATGTEVALVGNCFGPTILHVPVNTVVTWHNRDPYEHTVTAAMGLFDTILSPTRETTFRFTRAGVFPYYCQYHSWMAGAVVVGNASSAASTSLPVVPAAQVKPDPERSSSSSGTALLALAAGLGGILIGNAPRIARRARAKS